MSRILIIDDEVIIRNLLRRILEGAGHEVFEAENGKVGVELFHRQPVDLVITDLIMKVQGGLQTIAEIRQLRPTQKIIAISGGSVTATETLDDALKAGVNFAVRKPFTISQILAAVTQALAGTATRSPP